jgi:hypothetical protein
VCQTPRSGTRLQTLRSWLHRAPTESARDTSMPMRVGQREIPDTLTANACQLGETWHDALLVALQSALERKRWWCLQLKQMAEGTEQCSLSQAN